MPIGIIVLGCMAFVCVTLVVLKYIDKRDVNADLEARAREAFEQRATQDLRDKQNRRRG